VERDRFGLLRFSVPQRSNYRTDVDLAALLTSGWSIVEATNAERQALLTAGLWRQLVQ
jgi:hypothetical protein